MEWMKQKVLVYAMFECINFANLLAMLTAYVISQTIFAAEYLGVSDADLTSTIFEVPTYAITTGLVFYMLQKRELKNFFAERRAQLKSQEVTTICNVQSDAILVIERSSTSVLFNNKKSVSLFDFDFKKHDGRC